MNEANVQRSYRDTIFRMDFLRENKAERHEVGLEQGENHLADLLQKLMDTGRSEDVNRAISDSEYRKQLYLENI